MEDRIQKELERLRTRYVVKYVEEGQWVCIPEYPLPSGWNREMTDVAFQIPNGYPGVPPYGINVPQGITYNGNPPDNYKEPSPSQPPFSGEWGILSWQPDDQWRATADIISGSNLMNWVMGFSERFREGK